MPVTEPGFLSASAEVLLDRHFGTLPPHPVHQAAAGIVTGALTITVQQADDRERQVGACLVVGLCNSLSSSLSSSLSASPLRLLLRLLVMDFNGGVQR